MLLVKVHNLLRRILHRDYFDWQNSDEGIKTRAERLQPYLATGLDEQAGLSFEGMEWNSQFIRITSMEY